MTNPVSISTATQGTGTGTTAKAQNGGKASGFLSTLMAAIGHKPKGEASTQAASTPATVAANVAGVQVKAVHIEAHALLNGKVVHADPSKIKMHEMKWVLVKKTPHGAVCQAMPVTTAKTATGNQVKATDALAHAAEDKAAAQGAKTKSAQGQATALADAAAKAVGQGATAKGDGSQKGKAEHVAMAKPQAKSSSHPDKTRSEITSGTVSPDPSAMPQLAAPVAVAQAAGHSGAQAKADAPDPQAQAQGRATTPMEGSAGKATLAAAAGMRTKPGSPATASAQPAPETSPEKTTVETAMANRKTATSGQAMPAAAQAAQHASGTAQAVAETTTAGMQAGPRPHGKGTTQATTKTGATSAMASVGKTGMADVHPQDAAAANGHAGAADTASATSARTPLSHTAIQSYGQVAGNQTRPLPAQASLVAHAERPASSRPDAVNGPASIPGQDPTTGGAAWAGNAGLGQISQTAANPQTAMPQAPVHASGPWTAMAAMTEIGQAAANGHTRLELKLEPAHLGKVHVRIDSDSRKNIQVHLVVEQAASRQAIEQQLPNLRHALEQQGLNLGNFSMSSQQQGGGQGSDQPGQQQATTASIPTIHGVQASAPQTTNAPSDISGAGRLSIRI